MISEKERAIYESIRIPLAIYCLRDGRIHAELVSDGYCGMMEMERGELLDLLNNSMYRRVHPDDESWMAQVAADFARGLRDYDVIYRSKRGEHEEYRLIHAVGQWQTMEDGSRMGVIAYSDMRNTDSKISRLFTAFEESQNKLLYTDPITGLPNLGYMRQFVEEKLHLLRVCEKTPVIVFCDFKDMKAYNGEYGYTRGDRLMRETADIIREYFPDAMLIRGSDDNFLIFDEMPDEKALTDKILAVNEHVRTAAFGSIAGIHAGICRVESDMKAVHAVDCAREALEEVGDDLNVICQFYSPEKDERYLNERYVIDNFETALRNNWIKVYYQPILRAKNRKITLLEALARWNDPKRGLITPAVFIPVLSRCHLLYKLDLYMAEQVCREFRVREEAGLPPIPVSVNFSAQDFDYVDVADELNGILAKYGVERSSIIVEITEQDIAKGTAHFKNQLRKIRADGYKLWIDDFGSGYSSLNVFSQFDIDRIKFDMELLRHLDDNNGANRRILKAFVGVCRELGVHTLAEGVENEEQLRFLQEIDCEMMQGFYFYRPEPLDADIEHFNEVGPVIPHETQEERVKSCTDWLTEEPDRKN